MPHEQAPGYRFPTDAEMVAAIAAALELEPHQLRDGRRLRRINHVVELVRYFQRHARATGAFGGLKRRAAVAAALYTGRGLADAKRSMRRWEELAERAGLLRVCDAHGGAGDGRGIRWELLTGWAAQAAGFPAGEANPRASSCEARRRRERRSERRKRRVRPWCRRVGNRTATAETAVGRLIAAQVPRGKREIATLVVGCPPTGGQPTEGLGAHEGRIVDKSLLDATEPLSRPSAIAALERLRRNGSPGEAGVWLEQAERAFEGRFGPPPDGRLRNFGALELLKAAARWERAAGRIAALNGWRPPVAIGYLEALLDGEVEARRRGFVTRGIPRHLGYFRRALLAEARRNEKRARAREHPAPMAPATALAYVAAAPLEELEALIRARAPAGAPVVDPGPEARRAAAIAALELVEAARAAGSPDIGGRAPRPPLTNGTDNATTIPNVSPAERGSARRSRPGP